MSAAACFLRFDLIRLAKLSRTCVSCICLSLRRCTHNSTLDLSCHGQKRIFHIYTLLSGCLNELYLVEIGQLLTILVRYGSLLFEIAFVAD